MFIWIRDSRDLVLARVLVLAVSNVPVLVEPIAHLVLQVLSAVPGNLTT